MGPGGAVIMLQMMKKRKVTMLTIPMARKCSQKCKYLAKKMKARRKRAVMGPTRVELYPRSPYIWIHNIWK